MKNFLYILGCTALLSSCGIMRNYERPQGLTEGIDSLYRDTTQTYAVVKGDTTNFGNTPWQEVFTDPQLQALINKALTHNPNMRTAELTIQKAQAALKIARLAYYPSIAFGPQGNISSWDFGKATKTYNVPVSASWQFNLFSLRNNKKQAQTTIDMAKAAKQATQTSVVAAVANLYYTLQMLDEQLKTTEATVKIWAENVRAMELMKEAAMTTEAAVGQAKANYYNLQTTIPELKQNISKTEAALCMLLHEPSHPVARGEFNADAFPASFSTGVPLQLLANRPDVRAAELQLASAFYGVNIARSAFYPSLTIGGQAGWTNNSDMGLVNPGKILASAFASLTQPIFANGKLMAQLKISKLDYEAAQIQFQETLLSAGQEVSNALALYQSAQQQQALRQQQVETLTHTLENTKQLFQYSTGTSYLETLTAQQSLIQAQLNLISDKFDKVQAAISLYQALGGGREQANEQANK